MMQRCGVWAAIGMERCCLGDWEPALDQATIATRFGEAFAYGKKQGAPDNLARTGFTPKQCTGKATKMVTRAQAISRRPAVRSQAWKDLEAHYKKIRELHLRQLF